MSYDIWLEVDTGGPEPAQVHDVGNYTANVSRMWTKALGFPLANLHGQTAGHVRSALCRAVAYMVANPAMFAAMDPANGWGDSAGARDYLYRLAVACGEHPNTQIRISR